MIKNKYCSYCGIEFTQCETYPRICVGCNVSTWANPITVSVTLLSVWDGLKRGALIQKRNINPHKGEWALHGGYLNFGEAWKDGAVRELKEELNLDIPSSDVRLYDVVDAVNGNLLIFNTVSTIINFGSIDFKPNHEVSEIKVIYKPEELAFPSHTKMLERYIHECGINDDQARR